MSVLIKGATIINEGKRIEHVSILIDGDRISKYIKRERIYPVAKGG